MRSHSPPAADIGMRLYGTAAPGLPAGALLRPGEFGRRQLERALVCGVSNVEQAIFTTDVRVRPSTCPRSRRLALLPWSHEPAWYAFVARASVQQLMLFGFPPPGHPFWTEETLAAMAARYPALDLTHFRLDR